MPYFTNSVATPSIRVFGFRIPVAPRGAVVWAITILCASAYMGYLVVSTMATMLDVGWFMTFILLGFLLAKFNFSSDGQEKTYALLPRRIRALVTFALVAVTLYDISLAGSPADLVFGAIFATNAYLNKLFSGLQNPEGKPQNILRNWKHRRSDKPSVQEVTDVRFKELH